MAKPNNLRWGRPWSRDYTPSDRMDAFWLLASGWEVQIDYNTDRDVFGHKDCPGRFTLAEALVMEKAMRALNYKGKQ